jgi:hypothetical protein
MAWKEPSRWVCAASALAGGLLAAVPARGQQPVGIELGVQYWQSELHAVVRADESIASGSDVDIESNLGLNGDKKLFVPYARLGNLYLDYLQNTYKGSQILTEDITSSGETFTTGTLVDSRLDLRMLSAYYVISLTPQQSSYFGPLIGLKYARIEQRIGSDYASASARLTAPLPVGGAEARVGIGGFAQITAQFAGYSFAQPLFGAEAYLLEYQVEAALRLSNISAGIGYRYFKLNVKAKAHHSDEMEFGLRLRGGFVSASLVF